MSSNEWFRPNKLQVVFLVVSIVVAILTLNPIAKDTLTTAGTAWQNMIGLIGLVLCPILIVVDTMRRD